MGQLLWAAPKPWVSRCGLLRHGARFMWAALGRNSLCKPMVDYSDKEQAYASCSTSHHMGQLLWVATDPWVSFCRLLRHRSNLGELLRQGISLCELLNKSPHGPAFVSATGAWVSLCVLLRYGASFCELLYVGTPWVSLCRLLRQRTSLCKLLNKSPHRPAFVSGPGVLGMPQWATQTLSKLMWAALGRNSLSKPQWATQTRNKLMWAAQQVT